MVRRRALLSLIEYKQTKPSIPNNEIWYTSSGGYVATPYNAYAFGANIISNEYNNGKGVITFDGDVTTIGEKAFIDNIVLESITIPGSATSIGEYAFRDCGNLTSVTIGDSVTTIGWGAFYNCENLTSVTIGDSVTTIENSAFSGCRSLTSVNIPDSVTTIGRSAFYGCDSLTSVIIPDSVTEIGEGAFIDCESLTSVYCKAITPPVGNYGMFNDNASGRKIYVPMESVEAYKSATNWSEYADAIVGYDFGEQSGGNLITFTFDDTEYQAEEGMTWEEFCNSEYNINSFCVVEAYGSNQIWCYGGSHISASNYVYDVVSKDDLIINNHAYYGVSGEPI